MTTKDDLHHLVDELARVEAGVAEIRRGAFVTLANLRQGEVSA